MHRITQDTAGTKSLEESLGGGSMRPQRALRAAGPAASRNITKMPEPYGWAFSLYGGGSWIRTSEVSDNRFTVCPLWPLGNSPIYLELVIGVEPTTC